MKTTKEQTAIITLDVIFITDGVKRDEAGDIDLSFQTCADHAEIKKFCVYSKNFGKQKLVVTMQLTYIFDAAEAITAKDLERGLEMFPFEKIDPDFCPEADRVEVKKVKLFEMERDVKKSGRYSFGRAS